MVGDRSDRYDRFASALRAELGQMRLDEAPPDLTRLDEAAEPRRTSRRLPIVWAAAAVSVLVVGIFSYPTIGVLWGRRLISTDNQEFIDSIFERSLFDTANASDIPLRESDWFNTDEITAELKI